ncbi:unnamed protein product [Caenorhabditis bovis]|uniref:YqaE/Pmp3 family membrane protein n=1 Tax=Caenorhabditis bovis TaxID=2654633 RepID=A0A8S1EU94_9PELO|nr:unnamed protein product [Caenorhabditis bovis]
MCKCLLALLACFLPPIAVLLYDGCSANFCINILFTCLGGIPGVIHAWYVILIQQPMVVTNVYIQQQPQQMCLRVEPSAPPPYDA